MRDARRKHYSIYVNGELSNTGAYAENATGGDSDQVSVAIGRAGGAELNHYAGLLDELMIFDRQMSASEVKSDLRGRPSLNGASRHERVNCYWGFAGQLPSVCNSLWPSKKA